MKKFNIIKTIQLIALLVFLVVAGYLVFVRENLFHAIAQIPELKLTMGLLWGFVGLTLVFLLLDYSLISTYKRDYRELDFAVHSDPLSGLGNRNSCDAIINRYVDKPLPPGIACVMLELSNIRQINETHGYAAGNQAIQDFSLILKSSALSLCFVGRNGGNKFLAIFEDSDPQQVKRFLSRVKQKLQHYNNDHPNTPLHSTCGTAFGEECLTINQLVALSDRRIPRS